MITEVTAMQPQDMPNGSENARRDPRSVHLATRERLLPTSCACAHPTLPIQKRLGLTAVFLQSLFRARFPGTSTDGSTGSIMAAGQSQSTEIMPSLAPGQSRNTQTNAEK